MVLRFNAKHLALCLSLSAFFSCKKDDAPTPTPPPAEPTVFEQVQGRWNAEIQAPPRKSNTSSKEQYMPRIAVIEFSSDSTYTIALDNSDAITGKFKPVDSVINLSGDEITSISDLKISADSISFSYLYSEDLIKVKAAKADDLTISSDKKALLKNWLVVRNQEDGEYAYARYQLGQDATITYKFTAAGSLVLSMQQGQHGMSMFANWKWHATMANTVQPYSIYGEQMYDGNYFKIISLSNTNLTIEETLTQQGGSSDTRTYVLTPQ